MRLDHVAVRVSDLDRAIRFYTEVLGLRLMFRETSLEHREAFAFLELEGGNLELLQTLDEEGSPLPYQPPFSEPPFTPHLAVCCDDLEKMVKTLHDRRIPLLKGPLEIPGKVRWLYFGDPDNNVIEFVQWISEDSSSSSQ